MLATCSRSKTSTEWPQFRGPGGRGTSADTDLPEVWGPSGEGLRWRSELPGSGNSSPVVADGRVFLTAAYGEADRKDGAQRASWRSTSPPVNASGDDALLGARRKEALAE